MSPTGAPVLVVVEADASGVSRSGLEALSAARALCEELGASLCGVVVGSGARESVASVIAAGCEQVHVGDAADLDLNWAATASPALAALVQGLRPAAVVLSDAERSQELAARLSVRLDVGCASHCVSVRAENGRIVADRRIHGGRFVETVAWERTPCLLTIAAGVFPQAMSAVEGAATGPSDATVHHLSMALPTGQARRLSVMPRASARPDIAEAQVVVAVGRGIGGPERIPVFEDLADALGAGLGASRAVVDAGWLDHAHQVGQTGRSIAPRVYLACAISGAVQHLVGIAGAQLVLAINTDPEAPIFQVCDVGIVGDALEVVPRMTAALAG